MDKKIMRCYKQDGSPHEFKNPFLMSFFLGRELGCHNVVQTHWAMSFLRKIFT
jgi:hypothetical protein